MDVRLETRTNPFGVHRDSESDDQSLHPLIGSPTLLGFVDDLVLLDVSCHLPIMNELETDKEGPSLKDPF